MDMDLSDIAERGDRKHTQRLLALLQDPTVGADIRAQVANALGACEDPRGVAPLTRILEDVTLPVDVRTAASRALSDYVFEVDDAKLRRWWSSPDEVLQDHAMMLMDAEQCPDIVLEIAQSPTHRLHADAVERMSSGFWRREQQAVRIRALSHADPDVRAAAASALCLDEPLAAEVALLHCLADNELRVVAAAAATLEYYPSVRVLRALHPMLKEETDAGETDWQEDVWGEAANRCWDSLRENLREALVRESPAVTREVRRWLEPAWPQLAFDSEELRPEPRVHSEPAPAKPLRRLPLTELQSLLDDPGAPAQALRKLRDVDLRAFDAAQVSRLIAALCGSEDPLRRELAADWCGRVGDVPRLLELTDDPAILVRKSAVFELIGQEPRPSLAAAILTYLSRADARGIRGAEALRAFAQHAVGEAALATLAAFARDPEEDEQLRYTAVYCLDQRGAQAELESLLPMLDQDPVVTWSLHIALLSAAQAHRLAIPASSLAALAVVDNLDLRLALARYQHDA